MLPPTSADEDGRSSAVRFASLVDLARRAPKELDAGRFDMIIYWSCGLDPRQQDLWSLEIGEEMSIINYLLLERYCIVAKKRLLCIVILFKTNST